MPTRRVGLVARTAITIALAGVGWAALLGCTEGRYAGWHKAIVTDGTLYAVHASLSEDRPPELVSVSLDGELTVHRFAAPLLNLPELSRNGIVWDIADDSLIGVSGLDFGSMQYVLRVGKRPLSRLDPMTPEIGKLYGYPRGDDMTVAAHPILDGVLDARLAKSSVFYDLSVEDPDRMRLYVLVGGKLRISEFDGTEWQTLNTVAAGFDESFRVVSRGGMTYVCSESGEIYSLGEATLQRVGSVLGQGKASRDGGALLIDDRQSKRLLFVSLKEGAVPVEAWSLESTKLSRATIDESMLVAVRAALGHDGQDKSRQLPAGGGGAR